MRRVKDIIESYDTTEQTGRKKIQIIEWFQKHPGTRFDVAEVNAAIGDKLDIGEGQIRNYLNKLADEDVLQKHGEKRIAYEFEDDIIVPARYQVLAVLRHLGAIFDIRRWGVAGYLAVITVIWTVLTFPFWFLWGTLIIYPMDSYASISRPEFLRMAVSMTAWLLIFVLISTVLYQVQRWFQKK